jgi:N utilization substance protein B
VEVGLERFYAGLSAGDTDGDKPLPQEDETREFADRLVRGVWSHLVEIDARIVRASKNWRLERMARVDRNLLRLGTYELAFCDDIPAKVAINEAIEVAKRFGAHESPSFVNGILDRVLEELKTPV